MTQREGGRWGMPESDRDRALATRGTFLFHLRPVKLSRRTVRWTHTFGLGGSALVLWLVLASSGILMLLVYQPVPDVAWDSVGTLESSVRFGPLVRGVHYWSANLLIAVVLLHAARVVLTGGYHRPRRLNWVVGVALLLLVLGAAFTGYLLPWDQRAYWAVTVSTGMLAYLPVIGERLQHVVRGGSEVGADTLLAFYTYHTTVLPVLMICAMAYHFWRVRRAGGVVEPPAAEDTEKRDRVLFMPDLLVRETSQALVVLALVVVMGALVGAATGDRAQPGMSPNPAKAPWYFMGFQELLIHVHPAVAVSFVPVALLIGFVTLPLIASDGETSGRWFLSDRGRRLAVGAALSGAVLTLLAVLVDDRLLAGAGASNGWIERGIVPLLAIVLATVAGTLVVRRRVDGLSRNELLQTLLVFLAASFAMLTAVGVFLRGQSMALRFPWGG